MRLHRRATTAFAIAIVGLIASTSSGSPIEPTTRTASTHPMRYHVALPAGWSADREWPVLVAIPDAGRAFEGNLLAFVRARGNRPYILVAPEVLTCGGARSHTLEYYSYPKAVWDSLQGQDEFAFDDAGVAAVLADVRREWHGEPRAFLTGWEAGGHTVWALTFHHPERWRGVAPVTTNYLRRGVDSTSFSTAAGRWRPPIQVFREGAPAENLARFTRFFDQQTATALADARAQGFTPHPVRIVPGAPHGPLAAAVLAWCDSLRGP
jgi:pimeloyl-ACP methyl ester carboxylesterase